MASQEETIHTTHDDQTEGSPYKNSTGNCLKPPENVLRKSESPTVCRSQSGCKCNCDVVDTRESRKLPEEEHNPYTIKCTNHGFLIRNKRKPTIVIYSCCCSEKEDAPQCCKLKSNITIRSRSMDHSEIISTCRKRFRDCSNVNFNAHAKDVDGSTNKTKGNHKHLLVENDDDDVSYIEIIDEESRNSRRQSRCRSRSSCPGTEYFLSVTDSEGSRRSRSHKRLRCEGRSRDTSRSLSRCKSRDRSRGRSRGHSRGRSRGHSRGRSRGHSRGRSRGHSRGKSRGHSRGRSKRCSYRQSKRHNKGKSKGHSRGRS